MPEKNERASNIIIHGHGTSIGGVADQVTIHGQGKIKGDLDCTKLTIHGNATLQGMVKAEEIRIHGSGTVFGHVAATWVDVHGHVVVRGDCSAETLKMEGVFTIDGLLNAGQIEIRTHGPSRVQEIGGEVIRVQRARGFLFSKLKQMTVDSIEGDDIHLEAVKAKVVRGNQVTLGNGCEIDLVEYRHRFERQGDAVVHEHRQLGSGG
ncbi:polymer-forming cytoskeletal protein [Alicyclobacillus cycloheptanicus]|uniref:Cytoskeletal protein CcmA (Bactofilin family) n=1 Tax=Alicyclobacillus cycloheptanicus TaxID=1457 RepID=A0ABT9XHF2_9BACL|nr:polymer-forming cytoskeletal protein [Alicyclobacillus cycloheptanicus]MDQ0189743.1 cytoskeletal protein CcmA (bactofilin family) [Alicyclobacillus cycloheptanicus]